MSTIEFILGCRWPRAAFRLVSGELGLLNHPRLILQPQPYRRSFGELRLFCARSPSRQRTTKCAAGIGPTSTISPSLALWSWFKIDARLGAVRIAIPSGSNSLNRRTQSRMICSVTPVTCSASLRRPPSSSSATANGSDPHRCFGVKALASPKPFDQIEPQLLRQSQTSKRLQYRIALQTRRESLR
jgi:hypothetical protein